MLWWGTHGRLRKRALIQILEMPIFQSALLNSCGKGAISSYKNWAGEPRNSALTTHCPLPRAARDTAGQSLMSWTEGHFSSCETGTFFTLVSILNYFLANKKAHVPSILSLLTIVSSFFCLLGHCYQFCPQFPLHLQPEAFFGAARAVPELAVLFQALSSPVASHISQPCARPCFTLQRASVYSATESVQRKYLTPLYLSLSTFALSKA